ncbi:hypothetical protein OHA71_18035 [Streptomyces sp. NBC_00444]
MPAPSAASGASTPQLSQVAVHPTGEDRRITLNVGLTATAAVTVWLVPA